MAAWCRVLVPSGPRGWRRSGAAGSVPRGDGRDEAGVGAVPGGWQRASRWGQAEVLRSSGSRGAVFPCTGLECC